MSQSNKISNIIFSLVIILIIATGITITYLAIKKHNANVPPSEYFPPKVEEEPPPNYFTFKEVEESNTIDAFKEYPINPITIDFEGENITIDGLKDKIIEDKVNELLTSLDHSKNKYGSNECSINFNVSNVFSITCKEETKNINLTTGEEIILEELFQKNSDIYSILWDGLYKSYCTMFNCSPDTEYSDDYTNEIENYLAAGFNKIKKGEYDYIINYTGINYGGNNYEGYINYYEYISDITIYDRFLTEKSIFEYKVKDYCSPGNCFQKNIEQTEGYFNESYFLTDHVYLNIFLSNLTNYNLANENLDKQNLDLEALKTQIIAELVSTYNLNNPIKSYKEVSIYVDILASTDTYNQVINSITINEYTKENFEKKLLGNYKTVVISKDEINTVNMTLSFDNEIDYLRDDPYATFVNFENTLYEYIINDIDLKGVNSPFYINAFNFCEFEENYESCIENFGYYDLIRNASYSIDLESNRLYMHNVIIKEFFSSTISELIPIDIFTLI